MTALVYDSFDNPFPVMNGGGSWTIQDTGPYDGNGDPLAQVTSDFDNVVAGTLAGANDDYLMIATAEHGIADLTIELDFQSPASAGSGAGIIFRYVDSDNFWQAFVFRNGTNTTDFIIVRKVQAGVIGSGGGVTSLGLLADGDHTLRVRLDGNSIAASVGAVSANYTDSFQSSATEHGVHSYFNVNPMLLEYRGHTEAIGAFGLGSV